MPTAQLWWVASIAGDDQEDMFPLRPEIPCANLQGCTGILRPKGIFNSIQPTVRRVPQELNISLAVIPVQVRLSLPVCRISNISSTSCDVAIYSRDHRII